MAVFTGMLKVLLILPPILDTEWYVPFMKHPSSSKHVFHIFHILGEWGFGAWPRISWISFSHLTKSRNALSLRQKSKALERPSISRIIDLGLLRAISAYSKIFLLYKYVHICINVVKCLLQYPSSWQHDVELKKSYQNHKN